MWLFRSGEDGLPPIVIYRYTETRAKFNAEAFLKGFQGYLETDGYLEDGRCSFSNNLSENSIRPFTVGRKNWLFSNSPKGAAASATTYTLVELAKINGLNVLQYLNYLLEHRPDAEMSDEELETFMPWNPAVMETCMLEK